MSIFLKVVEDKLGIVIMKQSFSSVLRYGSVGLCMLVGGAQAGDVNSYIQTYLGDGSNSYESKASKSWSAPQGAQGPIRSDMSTANRSNPNDLIQAHLGGDGLVTKRQMKSDIGDSLAASQGPQGPIRNDSMHYQWHFPLNATGG